MKVALIGGDGRQASQHVWDYDNIEVVHYSGDETDRLVSSIKNGKKMDAVVVLTKWYGHSDEAKLKNLNGLRLLRWDRGLKQLSVELPGFLKANNVTNGVTVAPKVVDPNSLPWTDRVLAVMRTEPARTWTSQEIVEKVSGNAAGKQPRVSEALDRLCARGLVRCTGKSGRCFTYVLTPAEEVETARAEYLAEREAERAAQREREELAKKLNDIAQHPILSTSDRINAVEGLVAGQPAGESVAPGAYEVEISPEGLKVVSGPAPATGSAPEAPAAPQDTVETHVVDLGTIWARARLARNKAAKRVALLEAELAEARAQLAKAVSDEAGAQAMVDEMEE